MKVLVALMIFSLGSCGASAAVPDPFASSDNAEVLAKEISPAFATKNEQSVMPSSDGSKIYRRVHRSNQNIYVLDVSEHRSGAAYKIEMAFPFKNGVCLGIPPLDKLAELELTAAEPRFASDPRKVKMISA